MLMPSSLPATSPLSLKCWHCEDRPSPSAKKSKRAWILAPSLGWQAQDKNKGAETEPQSGTPGHGMRPEQVPSLPWVSVSLSVEGTGLPHLQRALWHSVLQGQPWRAHHCRTVVLLLCLSLGASSIILGHLQNAHCGNGITLNSFTIHPDGQGYRPQAHFTDAKTEVQR